MTTIETSGTPTPLILTDPAVLRRHGFGYDPENGFYNDPDDAPTILKDLAGREISAAYFGRDANGYDLLVLEFTDGLIVRARELGQVGSIRFEFVEPKTPVTL